MSEFKPDESMTSPTHHLMMLPVSNHKTGPLYVLRDKIDDSVDVVSNTAVIAEIYRRGDIETELSNARRIVACVNACDGFAICELEGAELYKDSIKAQAEISELRKQRDELVSALIGLLGDAEAIARVMPAYGESQNLKNARAAIAKAGGAV